MHIPLLRGRDFNDSDIAGRAGAVLISQSMATQFWPNQDPIGKRLTMYFFPGTAREVVGVVADVKDDALSQARSASMLYMPLGQTMAPRDGNWQSFGMTLAARTHTDPHGVISAISNAVNDVDSEVPLLFVKTMQDTVDESLTQQRFTMLLLGSLPPWLCSWRRLESTACCRSRCAAGCVRSAFAWPWARRSATCCGW